MKNSNTRDWYRMLLSHYLQTSDGGSEQLPDEELLHELLEAVNERRPDLSVDQYLS